MTIKWQGPQVISKMHRAEMTAINTTMGACILHARSDHGPDAHDAQRFQTQTGSLERSISIAEKAAPIRGGVRGVWGSKDTIYARRIELGFQGKDAKGRVVDAPAYPYLIPAAQAEYPKLGARILAAWRRL